jgi:hypothetical protein
MGAIDWDQWDKEAAEKEAIAKALWDAQPRWYRYGIVVFRWTVGLVVGLLILGFVVALMTSWNPAGGG